MNSMIPMGGIARRRYAGAAILKTYRGVEVDTFNWSQWVFWGVLGVASVGGLMLLACIAQDAYYAWRPEKADDESV